MKTLILTATTLLILAGTQVMAADTKTSTTPADPKAQREQMAQHHEKMAQCLRSDKTLQDCRQEMRQSCDQTMGEEGCMMMDRKGKGKMRGR